MCHLNTDTWSILVYNWGEFIKVSGKFTCATNENVLAFKKIN